jgi:hypothetical protein
LLEIGAESPISANRHPENRFTKPVSTGKARQPPFIKDAGAAVACKSRLFTASQRNKAWQSSSFPVIASEAWQSSAPHALHRHPHLLIREKKVCGDAGEPMRAVLLGRSGFGVQAVKKPNMIGFKP